MRAVQRCIDFSLLLLQIHIALAFSYFRKKVVIGFCVDRKKRCIIALEASGAIIFSSRIHKKRTEDERLPHLFLLLLKPGLLRCKARGVVFYIWGYADKQFFGANFSDYVQAYRLEAGLFGVGAKYGQSQFSYVIDSKAPYFDGRSQTDLEARLSQAAAGEWEVDTKARALIERIVRSKFQKYAEINEELMLDVTEDDIVVVGQCAGDAAWIETDSGVTSNVDLVKKAMEQFPASRVFYKPHPFNRANKHEISQIENNGSVRIIPSAVSFAEIAARRPVVVVNTSGAGLEAALRGCPVHTFGTSYYSHWGFTQDNTICSRRTNRLTPQDVFYVLIKHYCKYGQRKPLAHLSLDAITEQI
jgi:capsular polysaccharide export protein